MIQPKRPKDTRQIDTAKRLKRLFQMRDLIAKQPGIKRRELAAHFQVSERRIQEDLSVLRLAGVAIVRVKRGYEVG